MKDLKVEYEATESLVPYAKNANIHTEEQIEQIVESIRAFGFNDPIGVWTNANGESEVVEGHGRILAAKRLELEKVPVIHLDTLTDEQRRAYTHVHNQQTRNSQFDWEMLSLELEELDFEFEELGFDAISISENLYQGYQEEDDLDLEEYAENADGMLKAFNVIISCLNDEEKEEIKAILGIPKDQELKRMYRAEEVISGRA